MGKRGERQSTSKRDDKRGRSRSKSPKTERSRSRERDDRSKSKKDKPHAKEKDTQKGIEMTKNRLKSSLNAAIGDLSTREPGSSDAYPRRISNDTTTNIVDSVARQAAIDRIEEDGFSPATFKSDADSARAKKQMVGSGNAKTSENEAAVEHDQAMFGPMWKSKEIEKKQQQQQQGKKKTPKEQVQQQRTQATDEPARLETSEEFPLAHESLFKDPELKQQRWFNLWKERRKMAFEGLEIQ